MKVEFTDEAARAVEAMDTWWRAHRRSSPGLFVDELDAALRKIRELPSVPAVHAITRKGLVRRVLMPKTRSHVYYIHDEARELVRIISVWGAPRGTGPKL